AAAKVIAGVVHLQGAIGDGASGFAMNVPAAFRPASLVYVPIDLCNAHDGRLVIETNGNVTVDPEGDFSDAQCFTSLEGAQYGKSATGYTSLTLQNGWTEAGGSTRDASLRVIAGVVHFEGAIASGASQFAFTLPAAAIPTKDVFIQLDLCNAHNGRL